MCISCIRNITGSRINRYQPNSESAYRCISMFYRVNGISFIRSIITKIPHVIFPFCQCICKGNSERNTSHCIYRTINRSFYTCAYSSKIHFNFYKGLIAITGAVSWSPNSGSSGENNRWIISISAIGTYSLVNYSISVKPACSSIHMIGKTSVLTIVTTK